MPVGMIEGLKPCFAIKDSGVPWLGEVPEHWEVWPLKFLAPQVTVGIVIQPERLYVAAGVPCLRSLNISSGVIQDRQFFIPVACDTTFYPKAEEWMKRNEDYPWDTSVLKVVDNLVIGSRK